MSLRNEMVSFVQRKELTVSEAARRYGISRKTAYKWVKRYGDDPEGGGEDQSRRPHSSPRQTPTAMVEVILAARAETGWGGRKLHRLLCNEGYTDVPSPSTITSVLARHGSADAATQLAAPGHQWQSFTAPGPNALWQMDFKGPVVIRTGRVTPLLILDDYSRFVLSATVEPNQQVETVHATLEYVFRRYGLPARILCDNGSPWGTSHDVPGRPLTRLTAWLVRLGIGITHGQPYHPQTQGKVERCMRTLGAEALQQAASYDPAGLQDCLNRWRDRYNTKRPHEALALSVPFDHYTLSPRLFPDELPLVNYEPDDHVVRVNYKGYLSFRKTWFFASGALHNEPVAVRPTDDDALFTVWYGAHLLRTIDVTKPANLNWV